MSTTPLAANAKSAWIRDLVYLAFPEGEARERVLFDLVQQFSKMDPEDPEWLRYKLEHFLYICRPPMQCLNHAEAFSGVI